MSEDGFCKEGDWTYRFVSQPTPQGKTMKARIYDGGNCLELEGNATHAADLSLIPTVFQRVNP